MAGLVENGELIVSRSGMSGRPTLKGVPVHGRRMAMQRYRWLQAWWQAEEASAGVPRGQVLRDVVARIKKHNPAAMVSGKSLYAWQRLYEAYGLPGLVDGRGRRGRRALTHKNRTPVFPKELTTAELIDEARRLLGIALARLKINKAGEAPADRG